MIKVDDLEKFVGGPTPPYHTVPVVSINKVNVIILNKVAYIKLGKPHSVYLHYSRSKSMIVVEPAPSERMPGAFPVKQQTPVNWRINASPFCRHYGIRVESTERFTNADLTHDGRSLVLRLTETVTVQQVRRKKKTQ
ncbi:MAG: hypothetical protein ABIR33_09910 [Pyrinomonadaceae bacterium]